MPAKLERALTRLLLVVIAAAAATLGRAYEGAAQASLWLLAGVALVGLVTPLPTMREEQD